MKILFCSDTLAFASGLNYASLNLCKCLQKAGHEVHYGILEGAFCDQTCKSKHELIYSFVISKMEIINCQSNKYTNFDKAVSNYKYDVVISLADPWMLDVIVNSKFRSSFIHVNYCLFEVKQYPEFVISKSSFSNNIIRSSVFNSNK